MNVFVPYSRFLECQDRRRAFAAEPIRRDRPPTIDADVRQEPFMVMAEDEVLAVIEHSTSPAEKKK